MLVFGATNNGKDYIKYLDAGTHVRLEAEGENS